MYRGSFEEEYEVTMSGIEDVHICLESVVGRGVTLYTPVSFDSRHSCESRIEITSIMILD